MAWKVRRRNILSQQIDVALVYREMLGLEEALSYLSREGVPEEIAGRVLFSDRKRPLPAANAPSDAATLPYVGCRRKNRVHDAIVEAALKIETKLGREMALALLKEEQVPDEVAARVIAPGPRQIRVRKTNA